MRVVKYGCLLEIVDLCRWDGTSCHYMFHRRNLPTLNLVPLLMAVVVARPPLQPLYMLVTSDAFTRTKLEKGY